MLHIADALIIGGGPAGLGVALALCRQNHSVIIFDSGDYRNKYGEMHMVSTWDHRYPDEFRSAARTEVVNRYSGQCTFVDQEVLSLSRVQENVDIPSEKIPKNSGPFKAIDSCEKVWHGRKVILATGSRDLLPGIDGFDECWGKGVAHCLLCHGHEERGAESVGILALDEFAVPSTLMRVLRSCKQFTSRVRIYTHGNTRAAAELREAMAVVPGCDIEPDFIERLEMATMVDGPSATGVRVVLEEAAPQQHAFVVYHPGTEQASNLPAQLGLKLTSEGDIMINDWQETSQPGIFATGDCASRHKYFATASAMGNLTGASVAQQLQADIRYI
ncbi:Thioredoxin reductase aclD [Penicillium vulpinum]|uniref:FAD/NAD(P)-binding domain-containing protein n=1 Tax=Penicillium vulpinum TaxID=29845 RepID=A0A1V6R4Q2_9EURO|nr:Thioredoxin reductase aclD [Penicillium vulpinum]KAJ5951041.1 Thioredoxin reductase aclD [Penicillium vulpinum]OQD96192.1 hypothetical protein PENVUL_c097G01229 [Penicillium vulpinum]